MYDSLRENTTNKSQNKLLFTVMRTLLYEWYDDDGYLELCANEYCERPIEKGNEIWHTVLFGQEYAFCCDYCVGLGSWAMEYDYRKYRRRYSTSVRLIFYC